MGAYSPGAGGAAATTNGYTNSFTKTSGTFEFYQDTYLRFQTGAGGSGFQIAAVGTPKNIGVYGLSAASANTSSLPWTTNASSTWSSAFGLIAVGTFSNIISNNITSDYDDFGTFWILLAENPVKYRVTISGGSVVGCVVERWDMTSLPVNTKITLT